jgi:hypothetical protein
MAYMRFYTMVHSTYHNKCHRALNDGFIDELANMLRRREYSWAALSWCPVCTVTAIWRWASDR